MTKEELRLQASKKLENGFLSLAKYWGSQPDSEAQTVTMKGLSEIIDALNMFTMIEQQYSEVGKINAEQPTLDC